ncbi:MAG: hypothetical protein ACREN1_01785 [Candidatus Dormibacteria bacterium]
MTKTTTIRDGQGNLVKTIKTRSGCCGGCGWWLTGLVAVYVIAAPALYFHPLIWEVLAYIVEGVIVLGAIGNHMSGRADRRERDGAHHRDHPGHRGETRVGVSE